MSNDKSDGPPAETSEGAVEAAEALFGSFDTVTDREIMKYASIIQRLAVEPAVNDHTSLWLDKLRDGGFTDSGHRLIDIQALRTRLATAEAALDEARGAIAEWERQAELLMDKRDAAQARERGLRKAAAATLVLLPQREECPRNGLVHEGGTRLCECGHCVRRRLRAALTAEPAEEEK